MTAAGRKQMDDCQWSEWLQRLCFTVSIPIRCVNMHYLTRIISPMCEYALSYKDNKSFM